MSNEGWVSVIAYSLALMNALLCLGYVTVCTS